MKIYLSLLPLIVCGFLALNLVASARPTFDEDGADQRGNNGGMTNTRDTNVFQTKPNREDDLRNPSDAAPAEPPSSTMVNPHSPNPSASFGITQSIGTSLKNIKQLLQKYLNLSQKLPTWWKQIIEPSAPQANQSNKT
jgi:hypothetical protein